MDRIPNQHPLDVARTIDSFCYKNPIEIRNEIQNCPLSVRARVAAMVAEFTVGALIACSVANAEKEEKELGIIERQIFETICPELTGASESVLKELEADGRLMMYPYLRDLEVAA